MSDLAHALRELARPWLTAEQAAIHLSVSVRHFRERVAVLPDFPAPRYFGGSALRWKRGDLDEWADRQTERYPSRSARCPGRAPMRAMTACQFVARMRRD